MRKSCCSRSIRCSTGRETDAVAFAREHSVPINPLHAKGFLVHRLRALHASGRAGRNGTRRTLVVGGGRKEGMRTAHRIRRQSRSARRQVKRCCRGRVMIQLTHLQKLEAEAIYIIPRNCRDLGQAGDALFHREGFRGSSARLAMKAFHPGKPPLPLLHVDTTWKFREMIAFRTPPPRAWPRTHRSH